MRPRQLKQLFTCSLKEHHQIRQLYQIWQKILMSSIIYGYNSLEIMGKKKKHCIPIQDCPGPDSSSVHVRCIWLLGFLLWCKYSTMSSMNYKRPDVFEVASAAIHAVQTCCWGAGRFWVIGWKVWVLASACSPLLFYSSVNYYINI